jgi:phospholipase/carboxylesterase
MKTTYEYDVHLPSNLKAGYKYPVIFTLHGKGSNEANMYGLVEPLQDDFIIIGIRGNMQAGQGFQYYDLIRFGLPIREQFDAAISGLEQLIEQLTVKYPIDEKQRFLIGFSQGAILSLSLALVMGEKVKGIAALSGYIPEFVTQEYAIRNIEKVSILVTHGEQDPIFPLNIAHQTVNTLKPITSHITFKTYPSQHTVSIDNHQDIIKWFKEQMK